MIIVEAQAVLESLTTTKQRPIALDSVATVYIAGPMTGYHNYNYGAFFRVERELRQRGFKVINPARIGVISDFDDWRDYWRINKAMLLGSDAIYMLPGWEASPGACNEHNWAIENGLTDITESVGDLLICVK